MTRLRLLVAVSCCLAASTALAAHGRPVPKRAQPVEGEHVPHTYARAGCPNLIGRFAKPTYGPQYQASYVGGGTLFGGDPRTREEGTWGRDYVGHHFYRRVWLDWSHGRRYQGGEGAYKTDGPKIIHHE